MLPSVKNHVHAYLFFIIQLFIIFFSSYEAALRLAAHEHDAVDVRDVEAGGLHRLVADLEGPLD